MSDLGPAGVVASKTIYAEELAALAVVLDSSDEWEWSYEPDADGTGGYNYCRSCGWESKGGPRTADGGLSHREGCKLRAALDVLERVGR